MKNNEENRSCQHRYVPLILPVSGLRRLPRPAIVPTLLWIHNLSSPHAHRKSQTNARGRRLVIAATPNGDRMLTSADLQTPPGMSLRTSRNGSITVRRGFRREGYQPLSYQAPDRLKRAPGPEHRVYMITGGPQVPSHSRGSDPMRQIYLQRESWRTPLDGAVFFIMKSGPGTVFPEPHAPPEDFPSRAPLSTIHCARAAAREVRRTGLPGQEDLGGESS